MESGWFALQEATQHSFELLLRMRGGKGRKLSRRGVSKGRSMSRSRRGQSMKFNRKAGPEGFPLTHALLERERRGKRASCARQKRMPFLACTDADTPAAARQVSRIFLLSSVCFVHLGKWGLGLLRLLRPRRSSTTVEREGRDVKRHYIDHFIDAKDGASRQQLERIGLGYGVFCC